MTQNKTSLGRNRLRVAGLVLILLLLAATTALASELFGFKLNAGVGSTQSLLQKQGYKVYVSRDLRSPLLSSIEIQDFRNDYLQGLQLWVACYKDRVYLYKWEGLIPADAGSAGMLQRLLQYIAKAFGEPEVIEGAKTVDAAYLAAMAAGEKGEGVLLHWKHDGDQVELSLIEPLIPSSKPLVDFSLLYVSPAAEEEAIAYQRGR